MKDEHIPQAGILPEEQTSPTNESCKLWRSNFEAVSDGVKRSLQIGEEIVEILRPALESLSTIILEVSSAIAPALENIQDALSSFAQAIINLQTPDISEERKAEMIASYKRWGELGWTFFPDAPLSCFEDFPVSIEMANREMKPFCNAREMNVVFEELQRQNIKKEDLESAIFCYQHRQYKACALVICGILDAKMIRRQKPEEKYRPVGKSAVKRLRAQFEYENGEKLFLSLLFCVNLFSYLETVFANGNDFKEEPPVVNRNFISHGMNRRTVRQRDCIQLFLALNNLTHFLSYTSNKGPVAK